MPQIHQEVTFAAAPARVYRALMESTEHAAFTGGPAEISRDAGGAFTCHGGVILGRNIELVPDARIVQAWRVANWPEGVYSVARFELRGEAGGTRLVFEQDGVPADEVEHIDAGWKARYWEPLRTCLAG
jgi:activator of HSP90 ATPase